MEVVVKTAAVKDPLLVDGDTITVVGKIAIADTNAVVADAVMTSVIGAVVVVVAGGKVRIVKRVELRVVTV